MQQEALAVLEQADCLYSEKEVDLALDKMAAEISNTLSAQNPIVLAVMNGALMVTGQLLTRLQFPLQQDYVHATRYRSELSGQDIQWKAYPSLALKGRVVLLVDDILDEGETLAAIQDYCLAQGAQKVLCAVLVDKRHGRKCSRLSKADFTGLEVPDRYVFGCGMDYKTYFRNLSAIYAVADQ
ncbi:MAG: hypoxanthine-guanine phosphoribosyltransferase [Pseudohongiellaceae bacterium]|nr:hypoxanthine-guanine phosphoribosyltransferase [Pseudohongiellaceae bacterium]